MILFHGVREPAVATHIIPAMGFNERKANINSLFGLGVYFAENSSKSNAYCGAITGDAVSYMYLSRACMGKPFLTNHPMKGTRCTPEGFDSVLAE